MAGLAAELSQRTRRRRVRRVRRRGARLARRYRAGQRGHRVDGGSAAVELPNGHRIRSRCRRHRRLRRQVAVHAGAEAEFLLPAEASVLSRRPRGSSAMSIVGSVALILGALVSPLLAQEGGVRLGVAVAPATATKEGPSVTSANLLADAKTRELLRNGFPARIHYRLELWTKGGFGGDDRADFTEWDVFVAYDPTSQLFNVRRHTMANGVNENFGGFSSLSAVEVQFSRPYRAAMPPNRAGSFYYNLTVDVQTLTVSDLDALEQWLRGSSAPRRSNVFRGIWSGIGTLVSRILGGDKRKYE